MKNNIWQKTIFNITPCNVARSWLRKVTAPCNVACGSGNATVNSPRGSTLQVDTWLWNHDTEFACWQHPAVWQVTLGWHAIEFTQTSAILEFYTWFQFRPHHCSRHVSLHQSPTFYPNQSTLGRKKWRHIDFKDGGSQPSWILGIQ